MGNSHNSRFELCYKLLETVLKLSEDKWNCLKTISTELEDVNH